MNLQDLIDRWLKEHHPTAFIADNTICIPIEGPIQKYGLKRQSGDVWYVCQVTDDSVRFFKPISETFGTSLAAVLPDFFDKLDGAIKFYYSYAP